MNSASRSIEFSWEPAEFDALVRSCLLDDGVQLALSCLPDRNARILEAGCGSGRVVKHLHDLGYRRVEGVELNQAAVSWVNRQFPELRIDSGDLLNMPYEDGCFDAVLSFGVVEHFRKGLDDPLRSLWRVLKPGGVAVVTVPSFNMLRRAGRIWKQFRQQVDPRRNEMIRRICKKAPIPSNPEEQGPYHVYLDGGRFFEYRLRPSEFEQCCRKAGFKILRSIPISHIDGLYHSFGRKLIRFENWTFYPTRTARILNAAFKKIPFFHNHMHACVLVKPSPPEMPPSDFVPQSN